MIFGCQNWDPLREACPSFWVSVRETLYEPLSAIR
jgi:hypothetical protein